jgi:hypothetical protein
MNKLYFSTLFLIAVFSAKELCAQQTKYLSKKYEKVSASYSVPDNDQQNFKDIDFKLGWNSKAPHVIAIQFVNHGYEKRKFKFAIEDVISKKMVILDTVHNSRFGSETLKANSQGVIWSGLVDSLKDSFSLHVWDSDGDEFDKEPIFLNKKDQL